MAFDLEPEYDLTKLGAGVRGKYLKRAQGSTNLVVLDPDLAAVFPSSESVNRALRLLVDTARTAAPSRKRKQRA